MFHPVAVHFLYDVYHLSALINSSPRQRQGWGILDTATKDMNKI